MGLELTKQIYGKPPSTPLTSWIFRVRFYYLGANGLQNDFQYQLNQPADISSIPIKADLPKFETKYVTQKFFGSEKSYPILRKYGGDTTLEFYVFTARSDNAFILHYFLKDYMKADLNGAGLYYHKEFGKAFDQIDIEIYNRTDNHIYSYRLKNCIATNFDDGSLSYESDDIVKFTLTVHYDDWYVVSYEDDKDSDNFGMITSS